MRKLLFAIVTFSLIFAGVSPAFAVVSTSGSPLTISKTVLNPQTNQYVHSLAINDPMYKPGDNVTFHVTVANTSTETFNNVTVQDIFPDYVDFVSGSGNYDSTSKTLTFVVNNLKPSTTQSFAITGKVASVTTLPAQNTTCVANRVQIKVDSVQASHDSSSFCIQKVFSPSAATATPSTGPEALPMITVFSSAIAGFLLKKRS